MDVALFRTLLATSEGWLVGYSSVATFAAAAVIAVFVLGEPLRRLYSWFVWPCCFAGVTVLCAACFLIWYVESFGAIFIQRGIADYFDNTAFKKLTYDSKHLVIIKYYDNSALTGFLVPWRDGYVSHGESYPLIQTAGKTQDLILGPWTCMIHFGKGGTKTITYEFRKNGVVEIVDNGVTSQHTYSFEDDRHIRYDGDNETTLILAITQGEADVVVPGGRRRFWARP